MGTYVEKRAKRAGKPIVDATKPLPIWVDNGDIRAAKRKNPDECAFAQAAKRQVLGSVGATFFRTVGYIEYPRKVVRYKLPPSMEKEVVAFDRASAMAPGKYQLAPPGGTRRVGANKKYMRKWRASVKKRAKSVKRGAVVRPEPRPLHRTKGIRTTKEV